MKYVALFTPDRKEQVQQVERLFRSEGIEKVYVRTLSDYYQREVDEEVFITRGERKYFTSGLVLGGIIGGILAYLQYLELLFFPLLMPLFAAGEVGLFVFWIGVMMLLGGFFGALAGLLWGTKGVLPLEEMMVIYAPANQRGKIASVVEEFGGRML